MTAIKKYPKTIANIEDGFLDLLSGEIITLEANHEGFSFDIPVTGTDSLEHAYEWKIDGNSFLKISADGDGAGSIENMLVTIPVDLIITGKVAIGADATLGDYGGYDTMMNFQVTLTDWTNVNKYTSYSEVIVSPSTDLTDITFAGFERLVTIPITNTHDITAWNFSALEFFWNNYGSGDVTIGFGIFGGAAHYGSGNITSELVAGYFYSSNNGSGNISGTAQKDGNFGVAVGTACYDTGYIERNFHFYAEKPYGTGPIHNNWGIYLEDQEVGTVSSFAIETAGGKVQFGAPAGKNSLLYMQDGDVAHGRTAVQPTDVYFKLTSLSATAGGVFMVGISDADAQAFKIGAYFGTTNPTDATAAFSVDVGKADGGTDIDPIGNLETAFKITNDGTTIFAMTGDGSPGFFATQPPAGKQVSGANLTNNVTAGGTNDQIDNFTNLSVYATDAAAIRNAIYQLARKQKQLNDGLRAYGLFT